MRNRLIGAMAAIALTATAASAADIYRGPPPYAPAPVPYGYSWMGPYVGANLGYEWGSLSNSGAKPNGVAGGFQGGPVPDTVDDRDGGRAVGGGDGLAHLGRPGLVVAAGDQQQGQAGGDGAGIGGGGQGLAVAGVALRVLPHDQLSDERGDFGFVPAGGLGQGVGDHARGDGRGAVLAQGGGAVTLGLPGGVGRLGDRA